ncbi:hypothetical protein BS47DRAFT_804331 [Hydnum rufescens UP504]|uniref:Btz domain-containing protein n=1 Tax=Hydnum rufescens UP504 TaxID=1448309 RepID=A0A9P6B0K5_9AGAM|nr:hypothetical protein BS47DRAFT_804331 [Hydnum rufescens UP504]
MPALVSSSSQSNANKPHSIRHPSSRAKRLVRRRGRGRDELSDEEVEREALSDSDFSSKSRSIRSSAPSPPAIFPQPNGHKPFFDTSTNWSEMVTAEQEEVVEPKTRASKRKGKKVSHVDEKDADGNAKPVSAPRPPKPNPRQVYLDRLSSDPSYVPRVGAFWSHDERLMDKDLRSMSGWWRGRWQGKGRGTSRPDGSILGRGRGRSNFAPPTGGSVSHPLSKDVMSNSGNTSSPAVPATNGDRSWSHDGYEELDQPDRVRLQGPSQSSW